jgi:hypothetical protein
MRFRFLSRAAETRGSILLEVMVATLLVGILVVSLATAFFGVVGRTREAREQASAAREGGRSPDAASSWEWGPKVVAGWWRPGPILHLRVAGDIGDGAEEGRSVGLWVDGWLVGERVVEAGEVDAAPAGPHEMLIGPDPWGGFAEGELVVRVRDAGGPWGPPWRLAVPDAAATTPATGPVLPSPSGQTAAVAHRPVAGTSPLAVSWSAEVLSPTLFGAPFIAAGGVQGWGGATLDERSQWWSMEEGRSVDLYF